MDFSREVIKILNIKDLKEQTLKMYYVIAAAAPEEVQNDE